MSKPLRIAVVGTRGIPANYGGFETFAEQLGTRLAARGHAVTVYCRIGQHTERPRYYRSVELVYLPSVHNKYVETLSHTLVSLLHTAFRHFDVVYVCNSANAPLCFIPWLRRQRVVLNVDGLEWRRQKWGRLAKRYYEWAAHLASRMPIEVVTDADVIADYYRETWARETRTFPYGTDLFERGSFVERIERLGLKAGRYLLYVSRLEPENNALLLVRAFKHVRTDMPLVVVGDAPYSQEYVNLVKTEADPRVLFLGFRFGDDYHALESNAAIYVQATEVGGTHPALVEAMGHRNAIVAQDVPEHREVLGDAGSYFAYHDEAQLAAILQDLLDRPEAIADFRQRAAARVCKRYSWDAVTDEYEQYFLNLAEGR